MKRKAEKKKEGNYLVANLDGHIIIESVYSSGDSSFLVYSTSIMGVAGDLEQVKDMLEERGIAALKQIRSL